MGNDYRPSWPPHGYHPGEIILCKNPDKAAFIGAQQTAKAREPSPVEQALAVLIEEQRRTNKLLDELSSRLDLVIDHNVENTAEAATPYPQTKSPLQAQIVGQAIEASGINTRLCHLLRVLTL